MVVYGHRSFVLEPRRFLSDLHRRLGRAGDEPSRDELVALLVDIGEAEAGVADAVMPEADADVEELAGWREIAGAIAAANCASWCGDTAAIGPALHRARCAVEQVSLRAVPAAVHARAAEGFACYALHPRRYMAAADDMFARGRRGAVFCLGLRSIGSILAHVVAEALQRNGARAVVRSVRPRGHPFDRRLCTDHSLQQLISTNRCDVFAIVDEGPGLSGSSFAAAAEWLAGLGVPARRIVLMPAWEADPSRLNSARGARVWAAHERCVGSYRPYHRYASMSDWSAGRWRASAFDGRPQEWPASQPQHERIKFVSRDSRTISRFAGLGKFGSQRFERAASMAAAGFGPEPRSIRDGMLELDYIEGAPVREVSPHLLDSAADYLAFVKRRFGLATADHGDGLRHMIETNAAEAGLPDALRLVLAGLTADPGERVALDGRMLLHEWLDTGSSFVKVDALDHHDDDFLPGCRDIAWDLAGTCVEWQLDASAAGRLVARYEQLSGDRVRQKLPFYEAAYAAYRLGYARLARGSVDEAEAARFVRLEQQYANRLRGFQRCA